MNLTYIKDLIPRPAVASAAVAGSLYSMTESPSLSLCLGAIAGVSCCFFPEETKGLCTAFTAIASAQAVKQRSD